MQVRSEMIVFGLSHQIFITLNLTIILHILTCSWTPFYLFFYKHRHTGETYQKLVAAISKTPIKLALMNEPRAGKKLLVLDLDHTILDFKNATEEPEGFVDFGMF